LGGPIVAALTDDAVLAAALMAQAGLASSPAEARDMEQHFGPGVSSLAHELTHFGDIRLTPVAAAAHHLEPAQAEALRKMLLSVVSDPRLVLARLARQLVDLNASKEDVSQYQFILSDALETVDNSTADHRKLQADEEEIWKRKKKTKS